MIEDDRIGQRYRIRYKMDRGRDKAVKTAVLDFMMEDEHSFIFSARPIAGTQTFPKRWIRDMAPVDKSVPIKI